MKVTGIAMWACIKKPNTTFEPTWSIDVVIDDKQAKELKAVGLTVKENDDGDLVVKLKRKVLQADGTENDQPRVVDAKKQPFDEYIGNGSKVHAAFNVYEWSNKFGNGVSADLFAIQVIDLVPYNERDKDEFEEEDGFVAQAKDDNDLPFDEEV